MTARNSSAAARTLPIPGVDVRPQRDQSPPEEPYGPTIEAAAFDIEDQLYPDTHFVVVGGVAPLCDAPTRGRSKNQNPGKVCMGCRLEASRQRARIGGRV